jgi:hypothetical protein
MFIIHANYTSHCAVFMTDRLVLQMNRKQICFSSILLSVKKWPVSQECRTLSGNEATNVQVSLTNIHEFDHPPPSTETMDSPLTL